MIKHGPAIFPVALVADHQRDGDAAALIFPEGRFSTTGEILEFRSTAALLALQTDVPIIPMWHSVNYGFGKRTDVVIGEPIRLSELCSTANPDAAELDRLTAILRDKVIELRGMAQEA